MTETPLVSHLSRDEFDAQFPTPVLVDTALAAWFGRLQRVQAEQARYVEQVKRSKGLVTPKRSVGFADTASDRVAQLQEQVENILGEIEVFEEAYIRRGRWTRAFLVNNSSGHVHSSRNCSTTYPTTQWLWLPQFSGHDESEIVEAAGERACTVCYPSAPVEALSRPTQIFTPDEISAQVKREERDAKRQAAQAAKVTVNLYSKKQVGGGHHRDASGQRVWSEPQYADVVKVVEYKTPRAALNDLGALVRNVNGSWAIINGFEFPTNRGNAEANVKALREALEARGFETADLVARNEKRAAKERY